MWPPGSQGTWRKVRDGSGGGGWPPIPPPLTQRCVAGLRQMRASLRRADCLIEVHDARISSGTALHPPRGCSPTPAPHPLHLCVPCPPPRCVPRLPPGRPFSHSCSPSPSSTPAPSPPRPNWPPQYLLPRQRTVTLLSGAHIPLSGRNPMLQEALGIRPHILVLNKMDLADPRRQPVSTGARRTGWLAGRGPTGCRR